MFVLFLQDVTKIQLGVDLVWVQGQYVELIQYVRTMHGVSVSLATLVLLAHRLIAKALLVWLFLCSSLISHCNTYYAYCLFIQLGISQLHHYDYTHSLFIYYVQNLIQDVANLVKNVSTVDQISKGLA